MKFLFENFLKDKNIYFECVSFWEDLFKNLLSNIEFEKYFNTTYENGEDFFDGNPVFNFKVKNSNRAVLIVQESPESEDVYFKSWLDEFETEDETIEKLVIVLELSEKSKYLTIDLVKKWIIKQKSATELMNDIKILASVIPNKLRNNIYSEMFIVEKTKNIDSSIFSHSSLNSNRLSNSRSTKLLELLTV